MSTNAQQILTEKAKELVALHEGNAPEGKACDYQEIKNSHKRLVVEQALIQQFKSMRGMNASINESADSTSTTGNVANFDPVLIRMVRRGMPQLMAFDLTGVQNMSGPTGSIFAMRSRYTSKTGAEALHDEANSGFSGAGTQAGDTSGFPADYFGTDAPAVGTSYGTGMSLADAEALGSTSGDPWKEMTFTIERVDVSSTSRKLKASFSRELQRDLKDIHGLDAETELGNVLSTEMVAEQDREILRTINVAAIVGAQGATVAGRFDLAADSDGRWLVEKFKGLIFQIELEANAIAKTTRRGKGNVVVCSSNVASALNMAGVLDYNPAMAARLNVDETSTTFAGVLNGRYKVYVDPYATIDYVTVGYKGTSAWDAGVYFCPHVPLEMYRAVGEDSFNPRIGFATRYGVVANPFESTLANGSAKTGKGLGQGENNYYRKFAVTSITG